MYPIKELKIRFGAVPTAPSLTLAEPGITVFIGPNNSGKSQALREIQHWAHGAQGGVIIESIITNDLSQNAQKIVENLIAEAGLSHDIDSDFNFNIQRANTTYGLSKNSILGILKSNGSQTHRPLMMPSILLDGTTRLTLTHSRALGSLLPPTSTAARLIVNDKARRKLQKIFFEALNKYLIIDGSTNPGQASFKLSIEKPSPAVERSFTDEAIEYFKKAHPIESMSDGIKAFGGILIELFAGDPTILIIDEPEAFLHPSLAFSLGREICRPNDESIQKNVFVATHSAAFLMGCIQSGSHLNIVRLTHADGVSTARMLSAADLSVLMRNPLMRSTSAIEALFYDYVIVTEGDVDRAFYDEINQRLTSENDPRGIINCLFLRAQNKQTVADIVKPLRALGIPAVGIVDVDIYAEGGQVWSKFVSSAGMDEATAHGSSALRGKVNEAFKATGVAKPKEKGGVGILDAQNRQGADSLFDLLAEYGMFVVRHGEVEDWLPIEPRSSVHGPEWLIKTFEMMGENSNDALYMKPSIGNVWDFLGEISTWLKNPKRKGIPIPL